MDRWKGRIAIVTGASAGIGEAIAISLAEAGLVVVGIARRLDRLQALEKRINGVFHPRQCDLNKDEEIIETVKWTIENFGRIDVLVNNAGISIRLKLSDFDTAKFKAMYDTNVTALCIFTREVVKHMIDEGIDGHIFNINSVAGQRILGIPGGSPYAGTKYAVTVFTEGLRRELRDLGTKIRVTSISPGRVKTEICIAAGATEEESEEIYKNMVHYLNSKDIADALLYALSTPPHVQVHELTIQPVGENL